jgi:hypothetical protein
MAAGHASGLWPLQPLLLPCHVLGVFSAGARHRAAAPGGLAGGTAARPLGRDGLEQRAEAGVRPRDQALPGLAGVAGVMQMSLVPGTDTQAAELSSVQSMYMEGNRSGSSSISWHL